MITHKEARIASMLTTVEATRIMIDYITQQEKLQAEHEALKKDVARYFDLLENYEDYTNEFIELGNKLSKVGKEE